MFYNAIWGGGGGGGYVLQCYFFGGRGGGGVESPHPGEVNVYAGGVIAIPRNLANLSNLVAICILGFLHEMDQHISVRNNMCNIYLDKL